MVEMTDQEKILLRELAERGPMEDMGTITYRALVKTGLATLFGYRIVITDAGCKVLSELQSQTNSD